MIVDPMMSDHALQGKDSVAAATGLYILWGFAQASESRCDVATVSINWLVGRLANELMVLW
jgi:hypothetical protein